MELRRAKPAGISHEALGGTLNPLDWDIDIECIDPHNGMTPLMYAAANGHVSIVAGLLSRRASVFSESSEGCTALTFAAECAPNHKNTLESMKLLIAARSDVNHKSGKTYGKQHYIDHFGNENPIGNAVCLLSHTEKMNVLLDSGYDVNLGNATNFRPVWWAMKRCNVELARMLIEAGAEWDTVKRTLGPVQQGGFHPLFPHGVSVDAFLGNWPVFNSVDMLALRYDEFKQDMYTEFGVNASVFRVVNTFVTLQGDPSVLNDDMSLVNFFLDRGFDPNTMFDLSGPLGVYFQSVMSEAGRSRNPTYIMTLLDAGGDPVGNGGNPKAQKIGPKAAPFATLISGAEFIGNTVAVTAYQDWLGIQKAKAASGM